MIGLKHKGWTSERLSVVDMLQTTNNELKNHLSEILKQDLSRAVLEGLEQFQTLIIDKDIALALLRHELSQKITGRTTEVTERNQHQLDKDIRSMEHEMASMKAKLELLKTDLRNSL